MDEKNIYVTGNTVIDGLFLATNKLKQDENVLEALHQQFAYLNSAKKLILVTGHRRENFGGGFESICDALGVLSERGDCEILYPVHLNPNVFNIVHESLKGQDRSIHLRGPQDYPTFLAPHGKIVQQSFLRTLVVFKKRLAF